MSMSQPTTRSERREMPSGEVNEGASDSRPLAALGPLLSLSLLAAAFLPGSLSGCTAIAGIENRETDPNSGDGFTSTDVETGIRTTELCLQYCDTIAENCTGDLRAYLTRESCLNTCNALPPGDAAEPIGNTVQCRLVRANVSLSPEEECASAGPGGAQSCGSKCEAYCSLLESECPEDFSGLRDCEAACELLPDAGDRTVDENFSGGDTVQCRLLHLGAVGEEKQDSIHCAHARYVPRDTCVDEEPAPPDCDRYCDILEVTCGEDPVSEEDLSVYESRDDCLAACDVMEVGETGDITPNTLGCRIYHATAAAGDPLTHCDHASPTGDGNCGTYRLDEDGITGNCESYCRYFEAGCSAEFVEAGFDGVQDCAETCAGEFSGRGAERNSFYSVETARDEDGLQCRVFYAVKALAGDRAACALASPDSFCR